MLPPLEQGQRYWNPTDPNRPCYTCGARPSGHHHDGSPSYTCSHQPTGPLPEVVLVSFAYTLTVAELENAYLVAKRWNDDDRAQGRQGEWQPKPPWTQLTTDWRSVCAEIAASHITGLPRRTMYLRAGDRNTGRNKKHDIGQRTEVRSIQARGRGLRFTIKDLQPRRLGILMSDDLMRPYTRTDLPTWTARGWCSFVEARDSGLFVSRYSTPEKPEWLVPQTDLWPMEEFPADG